MEHESDPKPDEHESEPVYELQEPVGCGSVIVKLIIGAIVVFIAVVGLVFGACLFG